MRIVLVILLPIPLIALYEPIKVLESTSDLSALNENSRAELENTSIFGQRAITICTRFLIFNFGTESSLQNLLSFNLKYLPFVIYTMSTANPNSVELKSIAGKKWLNGNILGVSEINNKRYSFNIIKLIPGIWNHACFAASSTDMIMKIVVNGHLVFVENNYQGGHETIQDNLSIMGFEPNHNPMLGRMTDVNIWNRSLSEKELRRWTSCQNDETGNILNWNTAKIKYSEGLKELVLEKNEVCRINEKSSNFIVSGHERNFDDAVAFCRKTLKGNIGKKPKGRCQGTNLSQSCKMY